MQEFYTSPTFIPFFFFFFFYQIYANASFIVYFAAKQDGNTGRVQGFTSGGEMLPEGRSFREKSNP